MTDIDFLVGETVAEVRKGYRIVFEAGVKPEPQLYADVGPCLCADGEGVSLPLSALVGRTVASVSTSDGVLLLTFGDGAMLRCEPSEEFEAWQVVGGKPEFLVVCWPGGEIAVWDERTPTLSLSDPSTVQAIEEMLQRFNMPPPNGFPTPDDEQA